MAQPVPDIYPDWIPLVRQHYTFYRGGYIPDSERPGAAEWPALAPAAREVQRQRQIQQERERQRNLIRLKETEATARKLLLSRLTDEQRRTLEKENYFIVLGSKGNSYRISCDRISHNVREVGKEGVTYCAYPPGVPRNDIWLAQKLLIESNEEAFLKVAVRSGHAPDLATALQAFQQAMEGNFQVEVNGTGYTRTWIGWQ